MELAILEIPLTNALHEMILPQSLVEAPVSTTLPWTAHLRLHSRKPNTNREEKTKAPMLSS